MKLLEATTHTTLESAVAVYRSIAPVSTSLRGRTLLVAGTNPTLSTTLPAAVLTTALGTVNTIDNTIDMGAEVLFGRGRAFAGRGWQPVSGSEKRHGVTRGKPPREHRKGL